MTWRLAIRNLARNRWRSVLTAGGIAVATAFLIWLTCMQDAMIRLMVDTITGTELGHVQVHDAAYVAETSLFHTFSDVPAVREQLAGSRSVEGIAPRVRAFGLVGHGERSVVARIVGVDPVAEARGSTVDDGIVAGRWLSDVPTGADDAREVVLGQTLADQLQVAPGGELAVLLQGADGSLGNDLLRVVGIVATGSQAIDRMAAYLHLPDAQRLTALEGQVHELAVRFVAGHDLEQDAQDLAAALRASGETTLVARTWKEIVPGINSMVSFAESQKWLMFLFVFFIAALGVLNAQRMSALERRREFGVVLAVGLAPARLARQVVAETVVLSLSGALAGLVLGGAASFYHAIEGLEMAALAESGGDISFFGVSLAGRLYFEPTAEALLMPVAVFAVIGIVCGLWPALYGARLNAVAAIAGRN